MSYPCRTCGYHHTKVIFTKQRKTSTGTTVERQRACQRCGNKFRTREYAYEAPHNKKLSASDVHEIRILRTTKGLLHRELADRYNVTQSTITRILNHTRW